MGMFQKKMSLSCFQVETASDQYLQTMQAFEAFLVFTDEDLNIVFQPSSTRKLPLYCKTTN